MDKFIKGRYLSNYEWEQRKVRNNRRLGFITGVVTTLLVYILWEII
jgi:hypothetical protein